MRAGSVWTSCPPTCSTGPGWRCGTTPGGCGSPPTPRSARPAWASPRCSARPPRPGRVPSAPESRRVLGSTGRTRDPDRLAAMTEILNAHGSKNDIFVAAMAPRDFASEADLQAFVRRVCDRNGPFGGDGVYFYDAGPRVPQGWFFNPDGSSAEFCG